MLNRIIIAAALAVATACFALPASAQASYQCQMDGVRLSVTRGPAMCTCSRDVAIGAKCPFTNAPASGTAAPQQTPMPQTSAPTVVTGAPAGVRTYSPSELANLAQTISPQDLKQPVAAPQAPRAATTPVVAQAPASTGACWTKHSMSKTQLVELLAADSNSGNWKANMCLSPEDFAKAFMRMHDWSGVKSVSGFAREFGLLKETQCTNTMLKNMVFVSTSGQKMGAAGKCQEDEVVLTANGEPVFLLKAGKVVVVKDAIIAKP